jgi:Rps23 Pro-64 3,4-dihydroxylase Tpa1-like proline 4-hydroxylase
MNTKLIQNNYIIIPNFIASYKAHELSNDFNSYCEKNNLNGDHQSPSSHSCYNYISFLELLCEKTQEVSSILEETVLPTYVYSRVYFNGSVLEKHTDRDACEISLTLNLSGDKSWPIFIKTPSGEEKSVVLNPGDAMMYLGKIAEHWRNNYEGEKYTQVFLHYVRSRGDCAYTYFDKEKSLESEALENNQDNQDNRSDSSLKLEEHTVSNNIQSSPTLIVSKSKSKLEDYIHVFDDIFPENFCNEVLLEYKFTDEWSDALVGEGQINKQSRNCDIINITDQFIISKNFEKRKYIDDQIYENLKKSIEKYTEKHPLFNIDIDTGYNLLRYKEGQYYTQHCDSFKTEQRSVSCSIQLNEDYDGGEFAFFDREIMIRTKTGSVIMFPSNFMYPHEVMPVIKGTRYSIVTWLV